MKRIKKTEVRICDDCKKNEAMSEGMAMVVCYICNKDLCWDCSVDKYNFTMCFDCAEKHDIEIKVIKVKKEKTQ